MDFEFELEKFNFKAKLSYLASVMPVIRLRIGFIIFFMI